MDENICVVCGKEYVKNIIVCAKCHKKIHKQESD